MLNGESFVNEFLDYLNKYFAQSALSPEESTISSEIHLRFELGDPHENGSKERVDQSVFRATSLFKEFFKEEDEAWLLIKSFKYPRGAKEFYSPTPGYFKNQISDMSSLDISCREITIEEFDEALNEKGELELTDFTTTHVQEVFHQKVSKIAFENIFRGIANLEMGFAPSISEIVYIVNRVNNVAFHMYDDRGCIVYSDNISTLKTIYKKYIDWLVDCHRETFDGIFK